MKKRQPGSKLCEYFSQHGGKYWGEGERPLNMEINEKNKIVELWLTSKEKDDVIFRKSLRPIYQQYKVQNYLVTVFLSGESDLYQQTRNLLLDNRRKLAEREVQKQQPQPDISM